MLSALAMGARLRKHRRHCARLVQRTVAARVRQETLALWHTLALQSQELERRLREARQHRERWLVAQVWSIRAGVNVKCFPILVQAMLTLCVCVWRW